MPRRRPTLALYGVVMHMVFEGSGREALRDGGVNLTPGVEDTGSNSGLKPVRDVFDGIVCLRGVAYSLAVLNLGTLSTVDDLESLDLLELHPSRTQPTDSSQCFSFEHVENP
ncbi:hypothetical protein V8G54_028706 [Vigna mungo]|uniref:Uncharacterized protein n=1 Tax=Vigna mungo TaxID=3915 RepID=A0AAQ3MT59_VIGMU